MQYKVMEFNSLDSTNYEASRQIKDGENPPFVIICKSQISGRGQHGNVWESNIVGNLYMTVALKPRNDIIDLSLLPVYVSNKIVEYFSENYFINLRIKAPNDIYFNDKKVGGILLEIKIKNNLLSEILFGIGLNVKAAPELDGNGYQAAYLNKICDCELCLSEIANRVYTIILSEYNKM